MNAYILRKLGSDEIVGWSLNKDHVTRFIKKRNMNILIEKTTEEKLSRMGIIHIYDELELVEFQRFILRFFEYRIILDNIEYIKYDLNNKLEEFYKFIKVFKFKENHLVLINKTFKLIQKYIDSSDFINRIKLKSFIKVVIKNNNYERI